MSICRIIGNIWDTSVRREGAEQQQLLQHLLSDPVKDSLSGSAGFMSVKSKVMDLQRSAGALTEA